MICWISSLEPLLRVVGLLPVLAEQLLERLVGQHAAVEQRFEDRVVQRLHRCPARSSS